MESYTIDYDFRKIPVKNTGSYWILPYIYIYIYSLELRVVDDHVERSLASGFIGKYFVKIPFTSSVPK